MTNGQKIIWNSNAIIWQSTGIAPENPRVVIIKQS
jgi:hypothetical protein